LDGLTATTGRSTVDKFWARLAGPPEPGVGLWKGAMGLGEFPLVVRLVAAGDEQLRRVLEDLPIGVLLQGPNAEILYANRRAAELLGIPVDKLLGRTSLEASPFAVHADGSPFPGQDHPGPQALATGRPIRGVVVGWTRPEAQDRVWILADASSSP
jgi:PAS domain-containing protein